MKPWKQPSATLCILIDKNGLKMRPQNFARSKMSIELPPWTVSLMAAGFSSCLLSGLSSTTNSDMRVFSRMVCGGEFESFTEVKDWTLGCVNPAS